MSAPYGRSSSGESQYSSRVAAYLDEFHPGDRIGPAPPSRMGRVVRRLLFASVVSAAGVWAYAYDTAGWVPWVRDQATALMATRLKQPVKPTEAQPEKLAPIDPAAAEAEKQAAAAAAAAPVPAGPAPAAAPAAASQITTAALPREPEEEPAAAGPAEPLPPPYVDKSDPYQVKASAAGLHPGLSRALLSKLTAADYRNAAQAIDQAVTETSDTESFTWPRQKKPEQALFQVHFVPGAAPDCRRYVVTVTKDNWSHTALPMERCGVKRAADKPKLKAG